MFRIKQSRQWVNYVSGAIATGVLATMLAACGGGGGGAAGGCTVIDPNRPTSLPGCPTVPVTPPVVTLPTMTLALLDAAGAATTGVATDKGATLVATVKDANGLAVANALVSFTTTDKTGLLTPATGTAVSDASGKASVTLAAGTSAGAFTATATANVAGSALTVSSNYTVTVLQLTLSTPAIAPTTLAAGGTAGVSVTVLNGTVAYAPAQLVKFSSACVASGKAKIDSPVSTVGGVASTSYTDLGCGSVDAVTASIVYNGNTISSSANLTVQTASAGQLVFVSALPQNIALKGTGGAGRQESATLTFKVMDRNGNPVSGQAVNFALNTTAGGLSLNPASGTTGAGGLVTTTVASGTVNTPVRVTATLAGSALSTVSDQLVVSTGVPDQNSFSLSAAVKNVEGGAFNGCPAPYGTLLTARLADHFHNPAPDGTAVSFTAEGGSVDASCLTGLSSTTLTDGTVITQKGTPGECTVRFCSGNPRQADGRISVLAYALGEESFVDANGNNRYDAGESYTDLGDPFRNDRAVTDANANGIDDIWKSGNAVRAAGEQYIDSNGNGSWDANGDGAYNGVLQATPAAAVNTVHVRQSLVMVMSNSSANITLLDQAAGTPLALSQCVDGTKFSNATRSFHFAIRDNNPTVFANNRMAAHSGDPLWLFDRPGNPLPAGTQISFSTSNGVLGNPPVTVVANSNAADSSAWVYTVQLASDATQNSSLTCSNLLSSGVLTITVTTPAGVVTSASFTVTD